MILLAAALAAVPAHAQPVTRVKATLVAFDGKVMSLATDTTPKDKPLQVSVTPETRFVQSARANFTDLAVGGYAGAAVSEYYGGKLRASAVYVYADALRGTGEGRFPDNGRLMVNGTVSRIDPSSTQDPNTGTITLHYRGAILSQAGKGRTVCEGRASPAPYASPLACTADAPVLVLAGTPISALTVGDAGLLVPGANLTVTMIKLPDGGAIAPGVIVEKPLAAAQPAP